MLRDRCQGTTKFGEPYQAFALPGESLCFNHHPDRAEDVKAAKRLGGENRSNARRAAKTLAAAGRQIRADELPEIVRACILRVIDGTLEPGQASAVASLARTSLQIAHDLELERRIEELERALEVHTPANVRRLSA